MKTCRMVTFIAQTVYSVPRRPSGESRSSGFVRRLKYSCTSKGIRWRQRSPRRMPRRRPVVWGRYGKRSRGISTSPLFNAWSRNIPVNKSVKQKTANTVIAIIFSLFQFLAPRHRSMAYHCHLPHFRRHRNGNQLRHLTRFLFVVQTQPAADRAPPFIPELPTETFPDGGGRYRM